MEKENKVKRQGGKRNEKASMRCLSVGDLRFSAFMLANCNIAFYFLFAYGDIMKIAKKIGVQ